MQAWEAAMGTKVRTRGTLDVSRARQRLVAMHDELGELIEVLLDRRAMFRGYVYETARRCGKQCACMTDDARRHRLWFVTTREGKGVQKTRVASAEEREKLLPLAERYRTFRTARARWMKLAREARDLFEAMENARAVAAVGEEAA